MAAAQRQAQSHRTPWRGQQSHGARDYTDPQARAIVALLKAHALGRANGYAPDAFYDAFVATAASVGREHVSPRAFRAIVSDRDGVDFLVANEGTGIMFVCETADEAEATTRKLEARARSELRRVSRRRAFANERLGRVQQAMFA